MKVFKFFVVLFLPLLTFGGVWFGVDRYADEMDKVDYDKINWQYVLMEQANPRGFAYIYKVFPDSTFASLVYRDSQCTHAQDVTGCFDNAYKERVGCDGVYLLTNKWGLNALLIVDYPFIRFGKAKRASDGQWFAETKNGKRIPLGFLKYDEHRNINDQYKTEYLNPVKSFVWEWHIWSALILVLVFVIVSVIFYSFLDSDERGEPKWLEFFLGSFVYIGIADVIAMVVMYNGGLSPLSAPWVTFCGVLLSIYMLSGFLLFGSSSKVCRSASSIAGSWYNEGGDELIITARGCAYLYHTGEDNKKVTEEMGMRDIGNDRFVCRDGDGDLHYLWEGSYRDAKRLVLDGKTFTRDGKSWNSSVKQQDTNQKIDNIRYQTRKKQYLWDNPWKVSGIFCLLSFVVSAPVLGAFDIEFEYVFLWIGFWLIVAIVQDVRLKVFNTRFDRGYDEGLRGDDLVYYVKHGRKRPVDKEQS